MTHAEELGLVFGSEAQGAEATDVSALVHRYAALLFRVAHAVLRDPHEAEDVVQDTFLRVMHHRGRLRELRDERVWLVRIAWNLALDRRRRRRPEQMDEVFAHSLAAKLVPADRALSEAESLSQVLKAIDALPAREREALLLNAVEDMEICDVAAVLGSSDAAVRGLLFRARNRLAERLAPRGKNGSQKGGAR